MLKGQKSSETNSINFAACDLIERGDRWEFDAVVASFTYMGHAGLLPSDVAEYYGFRSLDGGMGIVIERDSIKFYSLVSLNDVAKLTFTEIADMVEADPANFFVEEK